MKSESKECDRAMDKIKCLQAYSDEYYRSMFGIHPEMDAETSLKKARRTGGLCVIRDEKKYPRL